MVTQATSANTRQLTAAPTATQASWLTWRPVSQRRTAKPSAPAMNTAGPSQGLPLFRNRNASDPRPAATGICQAWG